MAEPDIDLVAHIAELTRNTEAGAALATAALLDQYLMTLLMAGMRTMSNGPLERMFGSYGPLYELGPKADIAFAFNLIDDATLASIRAIQAIRNEFAHSKRVLNFESPDILAKCQALPGFKKGVNGYELYYSVAADCIRALDAKEQKLIYEYAAPPDTLPGK
jgi:hypothetical protein